MTTIGLSMIVKNEAHVIAHCLSSFKKYLSYWTIVDTGSTDHTADVIHETMKGIPGELHHRPWKNFGHNRSEALALARPHTDYTLVFDADEILSIPEGYIFPPLTHDHYRLLFAYANGSNQFWRSAIVSNRLEWRYVGVLHEYLEASGAGAAANLPGPTVIIGLHQGGRSIGVSSIEKYARDAKILEEALIEEPHNARYQFYLAQSYRDSQQLEKSIAAYKKRVEMGGWPEEVFYSLYQIARLQMYSGADPDTVLVSFLKAYDYRPVRAEPLCDLAAYLRGQERWALAHLFAAKAKNTPMPSDILFVSSDVYQWRALDEYAIAAYWTGDYRACLEACDLLLAKPETPNAHRERIEKNRQFANIKLKEAFRQFRGI